MKPSVSIIGASGYSGAELLKILLRHPGITVSAVFANASAGKRVDEVYPSFRSLTDLRYTSYSPEAVTGDDLVFIALPSGEAMNIVPALVDAGKKVIDLGGDFRLKDPQLYTSYYRHDHTSPQYAGRAVYGLPEWNAEAIRSGQLIANPGCYVTSILLPIIPLIKERLIRTDGISVSSLSGVSGAGRSANVDLSFSETNETVKAYKVGVHQHTPEIETFLHHFGGTAATVTFVPHLIPITRGIYSTMFVTPAEGISPERFSEAYVRYYSASPFVRIIGRSVPEIKHVQQTNFCDIGWTVDERNGKIIVQSVLDNLVKGAAGQAVQNMNLMFGFGETVPFF